MSKLSTEKKQLIRKKLAEYDWEDLHWVERLCHTLKINAKGIRVYDSTKDSPEEMGKELVAHFDSVLEKHHPGGAF